MSLSGRNHVITAGSYSAQVSEVGAGLRALQHDGVDLTCTYDADELAPKCCGTTLMPWPNRIRAGRYRFEGADQQLALTEPAHGNAIHGLGRWARWRRAAGSTDSVTLRLDVVPQNGYPFELRGEVTYRLDAERGLEVTLGAHNTGRRAAPFGAGSHPYLSTRGHELDQVVVQIPARTVLDVDDAQIPVGSHPVAGTDHDLRRAKRLGELRFDDGFTDLVRRDERAYALVRTRSGTTRLWLDAAFGYLQVFTKADVTPGRHGVAVEPMTCAPDGFNSGAGLQVLQPGERWSGSWGIDVG